MNSHQTTRLLLSLISLAWVIVTGLTGLAHHWADPDTLETTSRSFHSQWSAISTIPICVIQYLLIRVLPKCKNKEEIKEELPKRYLIIILIVIAFLTGMAAQMEFLPLFFHQLIVWPFVLFFTYEIFRSGFRKN